MSKWDWFYRRLIVTNLFTKGWGNPKDMKRIFLLRKQIAQRDLCRQYVAEDHPVYIDKEVIEKDCRLINGHFISPVVTNLPGVVAKETEIARFQMVLPHEWKTELKPICLHLGGTGDHGYRRRRQAIARPLLQEEGIASIILENPYYGSRKPKDQFRSSLHYVSDLFVMGCGLILESMVIFNWLDRMGYGPLGATGISMGGHMASLAATNWHKPISLIPCMSWSTASGVFTHGVLSTAIPWKVLEEQFSVEGAYQTDIMDLIESPEPSWSSPMYKEGQKFIQLMAENTKDETAPSKDDYDFILNQYLEQKPLQILNQSMSSNNGKQGNDSYFEKVKEILAKPFFTINNNKEQSKSKPSEEINSNQSNGVEAVDKSAANKIVTEKIDSNKQSAQCITNNQSVSSKTENFKTENLSVCDKAEILSDNMSISDKAESLSISDKAARHSVSDKTESQPEADKSKNQSETAKADNQSVSYWISSLYSSISQIQTAFTFTKEKPKVSVSQLQQDSRHFMRGVMDECTHLGNYSVPVDPELIIIVTAENDAYIPRHDVLKLDELWPGSQHRFVPRGHISGYLFEKKEFRKAIADSFKLNIAKYYPEHRTDIDKDSYRHFIPDPHPPIDQKVNEK